ncbi:GlsB/YeaQ/YmgE family stress response membrane protein [Jannaschia sp. S6380]|uniref:GlsB/YeaQ/YmgE family stress response membrane protein n=1 Tax=Jannaschia sp. S6380 TaxID=2926408 RepID=UPI001FF58396|nr:GlsB/YeaQ/YmgE family stress response membrane protein [Jannaschia sp. S6380]MCK0168234.1 GlsB/YeaQ/YmgE family stress response membrane protein [Jannaschia sp. S6380]
MEAFFEGLGVAALIILALVGLVIGWLAGALTGRGKAPYAILGAVAAMATPFILVALGVTVLAAGGLLLVVIVGAVGAAVVVGLVRAVSGRRS